MITITTLEDLDEIVNIKIKKETYESKYCIEDEHKKKTVYIKNIIDTNRGIYMNKEYIYKDGKTLIIDENNNQTVIDFYDNLDKVLVQENLIETIEKEIENLESEIFKNKNQNKFSIFLNKAGIPILMTTLGILIVFPILMLYVELMHLLIL